VVYHLMVALASRGVSWRDVLAELARRAGRSGLDEKASRRG
jgi:phosphoribosyl-ATP pyrophosphohydrolase